MCDRKSLTRELVVKFRNEDGIDIDGGAVKRNFFNLTLREIRQRLFEEPEEYMLPIKDSSRVLLFRVAGMVVVHSLIQGDPTGCQYLPQVLFPIFYPWMKTSSSPSLIKIQSH